MINLLTEIISVTLGAGGVTYAVVSRILDRKKYKHEVRQTAADADIKTDEFWKNRYDVLAKEMENKDVWWKERYDNLYEELQNERKLSNEIIHNFRVELNDIREDYQKRHDIDKQKYCQLMEQYEKFQEDVSRKNREQLDRINQLERLVSEYERKLKTMGANESRD